MDTSFNIAVFILAIIGVCVQAAVWFYRKERRGYYDAEKDADAIASELDLQLQSELDEAIKSTDVEVNEGAKSVTPTSNSPPRVRFAGHEQQANSIIDTASNEITYQSLPPAPPSQTSASVYVH